MSETREQPRMTIRCPSCRAVIEEEDIAYSHRIDIERLTILLAWEAAELTEGQAAKLIAGGDRLAVRDMRLKAIERADYYRQTPGEQR